LQTGIKINELCELKVGDIDLIKNVIFVNQNGEKSRSIPINLKLHFVLKDYLNCLIKSEKSHYLLQNNKDKKYHIRNLRGLLSKQFSVLKLKFSVNDLRNTFILGQLREGNSIEFVQKISGHKSIAATKKYLRYLKNYKDKGKKEVFEV
jgi:site-specific recombinase XerD